MKLHPQIPKLLTILECFILAPKLWERGNGGPRFFNSLE